MAGAITSSLPAIFFVDEEKREYPCIFMYAISGAGKTNALRTLRHLNPLVFATEDGQTKGLSTLADLHMAAVKINSLDELALATAELVAKARPGELRYGPLGPFGALAVDSLTGIGPMLEDGAKKIKGWDMIWDASGQKGSGKDPRSAYPYVAEKGRQVVRKLMALPIPLVLTCREQLITEGEGDAAKSYPAPELPGQKLPRELPGWPEATVRLRMINGTRVFVTQNEGDVVARVRLEEGMRLPKYVKPDLGNLLRVLQGDRSAIQSLLLTGVQGDEPPPVPKTPQQLAAEARRAATTTPQVVAAP